MNIRKHFFVILCFCLLSVLPLGAQNAMNVPFSQYGIGENSRYTCMPYLMSLGGAAYTLSGNNFINPFNPASYAAIERESFIFDMGVAIDMTTLSSGDRSLYDADGRIGYITFGMPITKWWKSSFGLLPYSETNYESVRSMTDSSTYGSMRNIYDGTGQVSEIYWGNGFNIGKNLRVGFNMNFLYGQIQRAITFDFADTAYMNSRREKSTYINNIYFNGGLQYDVHFNTDHSMTFGLTATMPKTMRVSDNSLVYTFIEYGGSVYMCDTVFPLPGESSEYESTMEQPFTLGAGLSFRKHSRWMVAADFTYAPWSGLKYTEAPDHNIFGTSILRYDQYSRLAIGFELSGDLSATEYLKRISWRAGFHQEHGRLYLALNDKTHSIGESGFSFGTSLPMRKGRSMFNITFNYSKIGDRDLIRRDCFTIGMSVSTCDRWFVKRKYN